MRKNVLILSKDIMQDAINIVNGVYAPLCGFLREKNFRSVLNNMRMADGDVWSIPIVLCISKEQYGKVKGLDKIFIQDEKGLVSAEIINPEVYEFDKEEFAKKVFGFLDLLHPGVQGVIGLDDLLVGGEIVNLKGDYGIYPEHNYTPAEMKKFFNKKGWKKIVAFQTRNVPHRGHEFLQLEALRQVDGLLVQPVIGEKKLDDFKDEYIISSYKILMDNYYPRDRSVLGILPLKMRYAGPREAVMHAMIRKNFGCTHFIVGRDHAGVGSYYPPLAAQNIFDDFSKDELGIEIMKFSEVVYCGTCGRYRFAGSSDGKPPLPLRLSYEGQVTTPWKGGGPKTPPLSNRVSHKALAVAQGRLGGVCRSGELDPCAGHDTIKFSGTKLRDFIKNKQTPQEYLIRPEVFDFLANSNNSLVDDMYKKNHNKEGYVLWFTGLSGAGKTTIADKVYEILSQNGNFIERLDGDIVRENLTQKLGFSKEDRDENIRRVGFVANLLSRNNVGVLASFISPYRGHRDELRKNVTNFIEVFVDAPLEICEDRDTKGLYKKARAGEIKFFTGIDDPYEAPEKPDIHLKTYCTSPDECAEMVVDYLKNKNLV